MVLGNKDRNVRMVRVHLKRRLLREKRQHGWTAKPADVLLKMINNAEAAAGFKNKDTRDGTTVWRKTADRLAGWAFDRIMSR
jgi:hypothetical protein